MREEDERTGILATVYECPKCGDVWRVSMVEECDTENDEVYPHSVCDSCGSEVRQKFTNGVMHMHDLTREEFFWLQESRNEYDEDEYGF